MMLYIKLNAENNNHGNPVSQPFEGSVALPNELLSVYIDTMGFCDIEVTDDIVTAIIADTEAIEVYEATHPEPTPAEPEPTPDDDRDAMLVDLEYRVTLLELGVNE